MFLKGPVTAHASWTERPDSVEEMTSQARAVVRARVEGVNAGEDLLVPEPTLPGGVDRIPTQRVDFTSIEVLSGTIPASFTLFKTGNATFQLEGDPAYVVGEEYVLFVEPREDGTFIPVAPDGRLRETAGGTVQPVIDGPLGDQLQGESVGSLEQDVDQAAAEDDASAEGSDASTEGDAELESTAAAGDDPTATDDDAAARGAEVEPGGDGIAAEEEGADAEQALAGGDSDRGADEWVEGEHFVGPDYDGMYDAAVESESDAPASDDLTDAQVASAGARLWRTRDGQWIHLHTRRYTTYNRVDNRRIRSYANSARAEWSRKTILRLPRSGPSGSRIRLYDGDYGKTKWSGIAYSAPHASYGYVKYNLHYLRNARRKFARGVACQEIGHILGLDHGGGDCMVAGYSSSYSAYVGRPNRSLINRAYRRRH